MWPCLRKPVWWRLVPKKLNVKCNPTRPKFIWLRIYMVFSDGVKLSLHHLLATLAAPGCRTSDFFGFKYPVLNCPKETHPKEVGVRLKLISIWRVCHVSSSRCADRICDDARNPESHRTTEITLNPKRYCQMNTLAGERKSRKWSVWTFATKKSQLNQLI